MTKKPTTFSDAMPLSVGDKHIINNEFVTKIEKAILTDKVENVNEFVKDDLKYDLFMSHFDKLPQVDLGTPNTPAQEKPALSFIATIPASFELGVEDDIKITIETDATSYDGDIANELIAYYNRALDTITPLQVGDTEIVFTATKDGNTKEFRYPIKVVDEIADTPAETPDNADEPNFTDEELAVVLCNRARYEDLKEFFVEWGGLNGMNDEAQVKAGLYQEMKRSITAIQTKEIAPTFKSMEVDRFKEAVKFIGRMGALMNGGASGMFDWWEEVPTLIASSSYEQESTEKLNGILAKHFILPMNSKEDFLYNYYLTSMSGRGIGGYSGMLQIIEWYIACAYEDSMWFVENLANIPLSKIEAYNMLIYIVNNAPYNTFSNEASKKEFASFYLSQIVMSGKTSSGNGKTREQILAEIKA